MSKPQRTALKHLLQIETPAIINLADWGKAAGYSMVNVSASGYVQLLRKLERKNAIRFFTLLDNPKLAQVDLIDRVSISQLMTGDVSIEAVEGVLKGPEIVKPIGKDSEEGFDWEKTETDYVEDVTEDAERRVDELDERLQGAESLSEYDTLQEQALEPEPPQAEQPTQAELDIDPPHQEIEIQVFVDEFEQAGISVSALDERIADHVDKRFKGLINTEIQNRIYQQAREQTELFSSPQFKETKAQERLELLEKYVSIFGIPADLDDLVQSAKKALLIEIVGTDCFQEVEKDEATPNPSRDGEAPRHDR